MSSVDYSAARAVLQGVSTPLSDVAIPTGPTGSVFAIVSTLHGILSADTAPGTVVYGNGSSTLWITGSVAQINAKLASLTYSSNDAGQDQLSITLLDQSGTIAKSLQSPFTVAPLVGQNPNVIVSIDRGTLTLDTRIVDGPVISLSEPSASQNATTALLIDTTIGARSALSFRNDNAIGAVTPRLAIAGRVELDGITSFNGYGTTVTLAQAATLLNDGAMTIGAQAARFTGAGTLINDGTITIDGDGDTHAPIRIDTVIGGTGQIALNNGASLSLAAVAVTETVTFGSGANTLHLAAPAAFAGTIANFSPLDTIVLDGISASAATYSARADASTGMLTLFQGQQTIAQLRFSTPQASTIFQFGTDAANDTVIRLAAAAPADSLDVYRFFDARTGAQMLTADSAERDAILADRPDLRYEGIGFQTIDPAHTDADAIAIYRFFDTRDGTHFLTASATERDTLLGTRPDLVYEPASTLYEHATGQSGDVAVYRFFDQASGAHFFTASAAEHASILATRPDLAAEGIAFYAPT